jgi:hypothetical protein
MPPGYRDAAQQRANRRPRGDKMPYLLRLFVLLLLMLVAKYASAQVTFDGCVDFRGLPVASVMNGLVQDVAMAT